jgi:hypothetical protein
MLHRLFTTKRMKGAAISDLLDFHDECYVSASSQASWFPSDKVVAVTEVVKIKQCKNGPMHQYYPFTQGNQILDSFTIYPFLIGDVASVSINGFPKLR